MSKEALKRTVFAWTIIIILIISLIGGILTLYITRQACSFAETINRLGIIRGSIQRLSKLELSDIASDHLIDDIEMAMAAFRSEQVHLKEDSRLSVCLVEMSTAWSLMKEQIDQYREDSSETNKVNLLEKSEEIWTVANEMVLASQLDSEDEVNSFQLIYIISFTNLLLGMVAIILLQNYVKKALERLAHYDELTQLYNRRYFNEMLNQEISRSSRYDNKFSLILFDIDHFKRVNDSFGHDVGDAVLQTLSQIIRANIRKSDVLARIGGEEFAVIATETPLSGGLELAEKLRKAVQVHPFNPIHQLTISLGISEFRPSDDSNTLFKRSDNALYKAKNNGRNRSEII